MRPKVYVTRHLPQEALALIESQCEVTIFDNEFPPSYPELVAGAAAKDGLLCLLTDRIDAALMDSAPGLKVISQCAVGYDNIDIPAATARGIRVGNTPGVLTEATADCAFGLMMAAGRRFVEGVDYVRQGKWQTWGLTLLLGQNVWQATLGIIGFGRIGQALARRGRGFEMKILYHDVRRYPEAERQLDAEYCELETLLQRSDYISIHTSLTPQTAGLIGKHAFSQMKPNAVLVNTARGPIVDAEALYAALSSRRIFAAALDVTDPEPLPPDSKLLELPNLMVVPHIASATVTSRTNMALIAARNLIAGVQGLPLPYAVN